METEVRVWRQLGSLEAEAILRPGEKVQVRVHTKDFRERVFASAAALPEPLHPEAIALVSEGKWLLDWETREFRVRPLALGGGCCESRPTPAPAPQPLPAGPPVPQPVLAPEFLLIYESEVPAMPYKDLFRALLVDANYTLGFLQRNISFLCSRSTFQPERDNEAVSLLRKVLYRVYFSAIKSSQYMSLKECKDLSDLIQDFSSKVTNSTDRIGLTVLQQGLEAIAKMQYQDDRTKKGILQSYDIWNAGASTALIKLAIFQEEFYTQSYFHGILTTEVNFDMVLKRQYADSSPIYVLLSKAVRAADDFALYILDILGDLLVDIRVWSSAFTILLEGNDDFRGLRGYLMNEGNQVLSAACESIYVRFQSASSPDLQVLASSALAAKHKAPAQYLYCPCQGQKAAILADVSINPPSIRKAENEYFHSRSRVAFTGPMTAVITGVPIQNNTKSDHCFEVNLETLVLSQLPNLIQSRYWHTADCLHGMVIITGGKISKNEPATNSVEGLSPRSTWTALEPMNHGRDSHSSCVSGQALYVLGGAISPELATSIEKYEEGLWKVLSLKLPFAVGLFAVGEIAPHTLLIAGGNSSSKELLCTSLDLESGVYQDLPDLPEKSRFTSGMYRCFNQELVVITEAYKILKFEQGEWTSLGQFS
jgi:hypothetical protein